MPKVRGRGPALGPQARKALRVPVTTLHLVTDSCPPAPDPAPEHVLAAPVTAADRLAADREAGQRARSRAELLAERDRRPDPWRAAAMARVLYAVKVELLALRERVSELEHELRRARAALGDARREGARAERARSARTMGGRLPSILER